MSKDSPGPNSTGCIDLRDPRILREQLNRLYDRLPFLTIAALLVIAVATAFFWGTVNHRTIFLWLAGNLVIAISRLVSVQWYRQHPPQQQHLRYWGWVAAAHSVAYGTLFGSIAVLFMDPNNPAHVSFVSFLLTGTVTGTLAILSTYLPTFLGYATPTLMILGATLVNQHTQFDYTFSALIYAYYLITVAFAIHTNRALKSSLLLWFQNLDLTESLRKQRDMAEQANHEKSRFLAAASHDLRQPIQALDLFMASLQHEVDGPEAQTLLDNMRRTHGAIADMLDSLLDISKLDAGVLSANLRPVALGPLLARLDSEFAPLAERRGLRLRIRPSTANVLTDPELITRILQNLIANAVTYTATGGILVGVRPRRGGHVSIEVWDTGIGITPSEQDRIFTEFYQLHNPERDRRQGLGLGLSIVRRLGTLLKHEVTLRSRPGRGSVFTVSLPCATRSTGDPAESVTFIHPPAAGFSGPVLVIEDDAAVREGLYRLLTRWGFTVHPAWDEASALAAASQIPTTTPPLILTDYRLPGTKNGVETIKRIRQLPEWQTSPAIVLTGDTLASSLSEVMDGNVSVLHKPIAPAKLRALIGQLVGATPA